MSTPTLKELIEKATPGPWQHAGGEITDAIGAPVGNTRGRGVSVEEMHYTGKFIARCNPGTMNKVLRDLENVESDLWKRYGDDSPLVRSIRETLNLLNGKPTQ